MCVAMCVYSAIGHVVGMCHDSMLMVPEPKQQHTRTNKKKEERKAVAVYSSNPIHLFFKI